MKTLIAPRARRLAAAVGLAIILLTGGCLEERVVWSPDGKQAAVISARELRVADADGKRSDVLASDVRAIAWLGDSRRAVLALTGTLADWPAAARLLTPERRAAIESQADEKWGRLQAGAPWSVVGIDLKGKQSLVKMALRDRHAVDLRARLSAGEWEELGRVSVNCTRLVAAEIVEGKLTLGASLHEALGDLAAVRAARQRDLVAATIEQQPESDNLQLVVVRFDGAAPALVVARNVAAYPDWIADGTRIVYFEAGAGTESQDAISLGVLVQREVFDADRQLRCAEKPEYLAGTIFGGQARVRCLRDGRVIFNAAEFTLPLAAEDYGDQHEQLFALDPARQPTLVRLIPRKAQEHLPQQLAFFDVSPDERQIVFGGLKGEVRVLTLASGAVEKVQEGTKDELQSAPLWRATGELTYARRIKSAPGDSAKGKADIVLRRGGSEIVLSRGWPAEVVKGIVE